ncbi:MAG: hypothetical protein C4312_01875, partial [Thermoflexus sp.]
MAYGAGRRRIFDGVGGAGLGAISHARADPDPSPSADGHLHARTFTRGHPHALADPPADGH